GVFLRFDVFDHLASGEASDARASEAWFRLFEGYFTAHPEIRRLNARAKENSANKPYALHLALACGLAIPETLATNAEARVSAFPDNADLMVKPVQGGDYCRAYADLREEIEWRDGVAASPALVQPMLRYPEYRVFVVGSRIIAFHITCADLDYRISPAA